MFATRMRPSASHPRLVPTSLPAQLARCEPSALRQRRNRPTPQRSRKDRPSRQPASPTRLGDPARVSNAESTSWAATIGYPVPTVLDRGAGSRGAGRTRKGWPPRLGIGFAAAGQNTASGGNKGDAATQTPQHPGLEFIETGRIPATVGLHGGVPVASPTSKCYR